MSCRPLYTDQCRGRSAGTDERHQRSRPDAVAGGDSEDSQPIPNPLLDVFIASWCGPSLD
jgi:hypothetical protein